MKQADRSLSTLRKKSAKSCSTSHSTHQHTLVADQLGSYSREQPGSPHEHEDEAEPATHPASKESQQPHVLNQAQCFLQDKVSAGEAHRECWVPVQGRNGHTGEVQGRAMKL